MGSYEDFTSFTENVEGFQQRVKEILKLIEQEGNFSDLTAEIYDHKKSELKTQCSEILRIHELLSAQLVGLNTRFQTLADENTKLKLEKESHMQWAQDEKAKLETDWAILKREIAIYETEKIKLAGFGDMLGNVGDKIDELEVELGEFVVKSLRAKEEAENLAIENKDLKSKIQKMESDMQLIRSQ